MGISNRKLKKEMGELYPIVAPKQKEAFLQRLPDPKATYFEVFWTQAGYIPKHVWLLSLMLAAAALLVGEHFVWEGADYGILWSMSFVMPVLAVLAVTETFRSSAYGMAEIEMAAKHNLPQVLLIRMAFMGAADLLLALFRTPFAAQKAGTGFLRTAVYLLVPWLCTCVLSLQAEKNRKSQETLWRSLLCAGTVCFVGSFAIKRWESVYERESFFIWIAAFAMLAAFQARQVWCIWHKPKVWGIGLCLCE